jgi:DNA-directed RNA polymerase specialized sigma24 family protein
MTRTLNDLQVDVESTFVLLDLVRAGDARALDRLFARYVVPLRRFAHGRLPAASRDMLDTNDLVQDTLVASLKHIDAFQPQRGGALLAYLRQALVNRVRDAFLSAMGRHDEALAEIDQALRLDPVAPIIRASGAWIQYHRRQFDESIVESRKRWTSTPISSGRARIWG